MFMKVQKLPKNALSAARRDLGYAPAVSLELGLTRLKAALQSERQDARHNCDA